MRFPAVASCRGQVPFAVLCRRPRCRILARRCREHFWSQLVSHGYFTERLGGSTKMWAPIHFHFDSTPESQLEDLYWFVGISSQILGKIRRSVGDLPDLLFLGILFIAIVSVRQKIWSSQWKILTKIRTAICCFVPLPSVALG